MPDMISKFTSKKLVQVYDQSGNDYRENKEIRLKTPMLRSDLCNYSDAYVEVMADIATSINRRTEAEVDYYDKRFTFKNNAPFVSCITKINKQLVENAEDLDVVMPMYNLIEYSKNYRKTNGSLHNYYRDEQGAKTLGNVNFSMSSISGSFDYKAKTTPIAPDYTPMLLIQS